MQHTPEHKLQYWELKTVAVRRHKREEGGYRRKDFTARPLHPSQLCRGEGLGEVHPTQPLHHAPQEVRVHVHRVSRLGSEQLKMEGMRGREGRDSEDASPI